MRFAFFIFWIVWNFLMMLESSALAVDNSIQQKTKQTSQPVIVLPNTLIEGISTQQNVHTEDLEKDRGAESAEGSSIGSAIQPFQPKSSVQLIAQPISVSAGVGAKTIDSALNEVGISYLDMNQEVSLTLERQGQVRWLGDSRLFDENHLKYDRNNEKKSFTRIHLEPGKDWKAFWGQWAYWQEDNQTKGILVETGLRQDRRQQFYKDTSANPFNASEANTEARSRHSDFSYFQIQGFSPRVDGLLSLDSSKNKVYLGTRSMGFSDQSESSFSGKVNMAPDWSFHPFVKWRRGDFLSDIVSTNSNHFEKKQLGFFVKWQSDRGAGEQENPKRSQSFVSVGGVSDLLNRNYRDKTSLQFTRQQMEILATHEQIGTILQNGRVKGHLKIQSATDSTVSQKWLWNTLAQQLEMDEYQQQVREPMSIDTGLEVKTEPQSDRQWNLGFKGQWRNYRLLPTMIQKLGDGMSLIGNENLPLEEGTRFAAGLWFEQETLVMEILPFYEQTSNEPMPVAVSPQTAKTLPLGSVLTRGIEWRWKQKISPKWNGEIVYSYQEAVNNSSISWQRGHALPGRPLHSLLSSVIYQEILGVSTFTFGVEYGYKSAVAQDLSGLWKRAPYHDMKSFMSYGKKNWQVRLEGTQLLSSWNDSALAFQQGMAGYDLLDPKIETTEYKILCEFFL